MIANASFPTAPIDVTYHTTLNISVGLSLEVLGLILIQHSTTRTGSIEVLGDTTTMQTDIGFSTDGGIGTKSTTIAVVTHPGTLFDINVGIGFLHAQLVHADQWIIQATIIIRIASTNR